MSYFDGGNVLIEGGNVPVKGENVLFRPKKWLALATYHTPKTIKTFKTLQQQAGEIFSPAFAAAFF
jgi:hypothetical protein